MSTTEATALSPEPGQQTAPVALQLAVSGTELDEIIKLRKSSYASVYPSMDLDNDVLDEQAIILFTRNGAGGIDSTARLSLEGRHPLPEHEYLAEYHEKGRKLMEWGRFVIENHERRLLKAYYRAVYTLGMHLWIDAVIMAMKPRNISMHQSLMGLRILAADTGVTYGGKHSLACVSWELSSTQPEFFKWIQE